ncbi:unnamed protein product [Parnassius mnemosyne]|uniref:RNA-directed DNA polymerase n=1 Tax=Parnassius mnemosyne TaxID=213953 RepID=A0AAV1KZD7_9NEOP
MPYSKEESMTYASLQQPLPLAQEGNLATNWREWKSAFDYFLIASGRETASSREKCALFMHVIGKQGREIYEELDISEVESHDYNTLCQKFNEHCDPKTNINYERHVFFESYQNEQNFEKFLGSLKIKAKNCEFGSLKNSLILTQLIRGLNDGQMREKLLSKATLTLEEASGWCRAAERAGEQAAACSSRQTCVSNTVEYMQSRYKRMPNKTTLRNVSNPIRDQDRQRTTHDFRYKRDEKSMNVGYHTRNKLRGNNNNCNKCNLGHGVRVKCPAYAVKCYRCDKVGHYAKCCRARFAREVLDADGTGNGIHDEEDCSEHSDVDNGELLMYNISIEASDNSRESWYSNIKVNGVIVKFKLDSGADASVMSLNCYQKAGFDIKKLKKCNIVLREISKKRLPVVGYFKALLQSNKYSIFQNVYVLNVNCNNLLSLKACVSLKLLTRINNLTLSNVNIDEDVFEGLGCLPFSCKIITDPKVPPVVNGVRKIPIKLRPRLKEELNKMEELGVIKKEEGPTDWYKPGKLLFIADTLSRSATQKGQDDLSDKVMIHENMTFENVEASMDMLQRIKKETHNDPVMIALGEYYQKGWPFNKKQVSELVKPYWNVHNELHMIRGVLFRNNRIVIPLSLRKEMLRRIHEGHLGVEKCQRRARDVMWWPGMSADITCVVQGCDTCQRHQAAAPRQPLAPHPVPTLPWEHLAADIFEFGGKQYLLIVDYYSKFVEISLLTNLQSKTVINVMKGIFSRFGIPKKIVTDNGTQFTSDDFKIFSKAWGFEHVTSSPHYPRSNGLAERNVRTVKSILIKSHETGEDWQLALLNFRNTPITGEKYSPAQLLMSRRLNTRLPVHQDVLRPKTVNARLVKENRLKKCDKVKEYYNKGTKPLTSLKPGETVRMRDKKTWEKAKVMARARGERSYWLETKNGRVLRRNRQHIMKLPTKLTALDRRCKAKTHQRNVSKQLDWDDFKDTETNSLPRGTSERSPPPVNERFSPIYITRSGRVVRRPERFEINN